jgi:hypothetical protein
VRIIGFLHETTWCGRAKKSLAVAPKTVNLSGLSRLTNGHLSTAMHAKAFTEPASGQEHTKAPCDSAVREIRPGKLKWDRVSAEKVDWTARLLSDLLAPVQDRSAAIL